MDVHVKPLGNRVLLKRLKMAVSKGGILLPETVQEKPKEGEVISVGEGKLDENGKLIPLAVKTGDRVVFSSYAGSEVKVENSDEEYLIVSEDEILGVLV